MQISDVLASWEYDDANPPRLVVSVEADGLRIALLEEVARGKNSFDVRRVAFRAEDDDGSWTLTDKSSLFAPLFRHERYEPSPSILRGTTLAARDANEVCRLFFWRQKRGLWRASLSPFSVGLCQKRQRTQKFSPATAFSFERAVRELPSSQTLELLRGEADNSASAVGFALRFHQMSGDERLATALGFPDVAHFKTAQREAENVLRYVLQTSKKMWKNRSEVLWRLTTRYVAENRRGLANVNRLRKWEEALLEYGPLRPHSTSLTLDHYWKTTDVLAQVMVQAPTFHEQLEARLELRAWARAHLPPDVCAELERLEV